MLIPCPGPGQLDLLRNLTLPKTVFWSMILQLKDRCFPLSSLHREAGAPVAMTVTETTKAKKGSSVKRSSTNLRADGTWMTTKNQTANSELVKAEVVSFTVVGVGASAGGLEAFTLLLQHLPPDTGMGFVLVQHLDPVHESALTKLLSKATSMAVHNWLDTF